MKKTKPNAIYKLVSIALSILIVFSGSRCAFANEEITQDQTDTIAGEQLEQDNTDPSAEEGSNQDVPDEPEPVTNPAEAFEIEGSAEQNETIEDPIDSDNPELRAINSEKQLKSLKIALKNSPACVGGSYELNIQFDCSGFKAADADDFIITKRIDGASSADTQLEAVLEGIEYTKPDGTLGETVVLSGTLYIGEDEASSIIAVYLEARYEDQAVSDEILVSIRSASGAGYYETVYTDGDYQYQIDDRHYAMIVKYMHPGYSGVLEIPSTMHSEDGQETFPVRDIDNYVFKNCEASEIIIPEGVEGIGSNAFYGVKATDITFPSSLRAIGEFAFGHSGIQSLDLTGVYYFGQYAFSSCSELTSVNLPNTLKKTGIGVFNGCNSLKTLEIPGSVRTIEAIAPSGIEHFILNEGTVEFGRNVFAGLTELTEINIPSTLECTPYYLKAKNVFDRNFKLQNIRVGEGSRSFKSIDGVLFTADGKTLLLYPMGRTDEEYTVPEGTVTIGEDFLSSNVWSNTYIKRVTLPDSVTRIEAYAFKDCTNLEEINLDNIKHFGICAFQNCGKLRSDIDLTDCLVNDYAFMDCHSITHIEFHGKCTLRNQCFQRVGVSEIYFPDGMEELGFCTFAGSNALTTVRLPSDLQALSSVVEGCSGLKELEIPSSVTSIERYALENLHLDKDIVIPDGVQKIGTEAFAGFSQPGDLEIPSDVSLIDYAAFRNCNCLKKVELVNESLKLYNSAFEGCNELEEASLPYGLNRLGSSTFKDCTALETVELPESITRIETSAFQGCSALKEISLPDEVSRIEDNAFSGCSELTILIIPSNVTYLGCIRNCPKMKEVLFAGHELPETGYSMLLFDTPAEIHTLPDATWTGTGRWGELHKDLTVEYFATVLPVVGIYDPEKIFYVTAESVHGQATVLYADAEDAEYGEAPPSYSAVGDYITYYKVLVPHFEPFYGTAEVSIIPEMTPEDIDVPDCVYNGNEQHPVPTVTLGNKVLVMGEDFTVSYSDNINAGEGQVTVIGKGKYNGVSASTRFTIQPKSIEPSATIAKCTYNGNVQSPKPIVRDGNTVLTEETDYTVSYASGRKNVGTYRVTITLIGNYEGSKTASFNIVPKPAAIAKISKAKKAFTVKWKKQDALMSASRITGYQIQYSTNGKFSSGNKIVTVKGYGKTTRKISKLKTKKKYYVRIRTYMTVGGSTYYSDWSAAKSVKTR